MYEVTQINLLILLLKVPGISTSDIRMDIIHHHSIICRMLFTFVTGKVQGFRHWLRPEPRQFHDDMLRKSVLIHAVTCHALIVYHWHI